MKIFGPKNDLGGCAMGRLNRWAALLMEFNFVIKHIKGSSNTTADNLSRLPLCVGGGDAEYPSGQLQRLQQGPQCPLLLPAVLCVDVAVMVQMLAQQPQEEVCEVTIHQVVGEPCK